MHKPFRGNRGVDEEMKYKLLLDKNEDIERDIKDDANDCKSILDEDHGILIVTMIILKLKLQLVHTQSSQLVRYYEPEESINRWLLYSRI